MVLGDFNARVGCNHQVWKDVIGRNGVGKCNSNGEMLITKCAEHNLTITKTHSLDRKTEGKHPGDIRDQGTGTS